MPGVPATGARSAGARGSSPLPKRALGDLCGSISRAIMRARGLARVARGSGHVRSAGKAGSHGGCAREHTRRRGGGGGKAESSADMGGRGARGADRRLAALGELCVHLAVVVPGGQDLPHCGRAVAAHGHARRAHRRYAAGKRGHAYRHRVSLRLAGHHRGVARRHDPVGHPTGGRFGGPVRGRLHGRSCAVRGGVLHGRGSHRLPQDSLGRDVLAHEPAARPCGHGPVARGVHCVVPRAVRVSAGGAGGGACGLRAAVLVAGLGRHAPPGRQPHAPAASRRGPGRLVQLDAAHPAGHRGIRVRPDGRRARRAPRLDGGVGRASRGRAGGGPSVARGEPGAQPAPGGGADLRAGPGGHGGGGGARLGAGRARLGGRLGQRAGLCRVLFLYGCVLGRPGPSRQPARRAHLRLGLPGVSGLTAAWPRVRRRLGPWFGAGGVGPGVPRGGARPLRCRAARVQRPARGAPPMARRWPGR